MSSQQIRRQNTALGRSGPRSKTGCRTCRHRRVRCDEKKPVCGHCDRLKLECVYQSPQPRKRRRQGQQSQGSVDIQDGDTITVTPYSGHGGHGNAASGQNSAVLPVVAIMPGQAGEQQMAPPGTDSPVAQHSNPLNNTSMDIVTENVALDDATLMSNFVSMDHSRGDWEFTALTDYLPLPDPAFSFTSLGFTASTSLFESDHASITQPITTPGSGQSCNSPRSATDPTLQSSQTHRSPRATRKPKGAPRPRFSISPPILTPPQEEQLWNLFESAVQPPASLVGVDPLGWIKFRRYILRLAHHDNEHVVLSLFALSTILFGSKTVLHRTGINLDNYLLFASRLHDAACAAMETTLSYEQLEGKRMRALLVSVFLLAWFEIAQDEQNQARPVFPTRMADQIIVEGEDWDTGSTHLFQWLDSFDAKMSHLGGRHLLSEPSLAVVRKSQSSLTAGESFNTGDEENGSGDDTATEQSTHSQVQKENTNRATTQGNRLGYLLSTTVSQSLPRNVIRLDIFNILLHPAFEFHMASQAYSRRIGCYDRHHRSRGTPEDEREVMNACMGFEEDLQALWKKRPGVLSLSAEQLGYFVSSDIASRLEQLFSIYMATFWNHFIYIHRVAFWTLKHTPIVKKAIYEAGNMMRRSVGQPIDDYLFDRSLPRTPANSIHPGLMWVCFLWGCEVEDPVQQEWAVLQLEALGKLSSLDLDEAPAQGEELFAFRLDEKAAQNAIRASKLLAVLIDRQKGLGARVDGKYLSQEIFGCHFYII